MEEEFLEDLLMAADDVMERDPGIDFDKWADILMQEYPGEVADAIGTNEDIIFASLREIWKARFKCPRIAPNFSDE